MVALSGGGVGRKDCPGYCWEDIKVGMKAERKNEENEVDKKLTVSPGSKKFKGRMKKRRGKERSRGKSLGSKDAFRGRGSLREKAVVEEERPSSGGSSSVQVQRCGFIKWEVHGVVAAGESPSYSVYERVVLARSNGTIEVRNSKPGLPVVGYLPSLGVEITSVTFHDDRVLIGSLDGFVAVYDYDRRILLENIDPCGGAIWCLQPSPDAKQIAVGCEDGTVRLLTYGEEGRYDVKKLEKGMARVTTVSWYPDGLSVVAGDGNGGLRRLEISTGRSVASAQIVSKNEFCAIWSCVVSGDTVLTGDSRGVVTIWNGEMLLAEKELWLEGLTGDITSLCESDGSVFVGAANGAVGLVARTVEGGWVAHRGTRVHTNDVRAIVRLGHQGKILSVGDDSVIAVHTVKSMLSNEQAIRIRPSLAPEVMPPVFACNGKVLALYDDRVELWSLPSQKKRYEWPKLLLRIKPGDLGGNLVSASVSTDLTKLVVSGRTTMAAFELDLSFPVNVYPLSSSLPPSRWLSFIDNTELAYVSMDGSEAAVIDVITGETKVKWKAKETCDMGGRKKQPFFKVVDARSDGTIVIVDSTGTMHFRTIDDLAEKRRSRVPVKVNISEKQRGRSARGKKSTRRFLLTIDFCSSVAGLCLLSLKGKQVRACDFASYGRHFGFYIRKKNIFIEFQRW